MLAHTNHASPAICISILVSGYQFWNCKQFTDCLQSSRPPFPVLLPARFGYQELITVSLRITPAMWTCTPLAPCLEYWSTMKQYLLKQLVYVQFSKGCYVLSATTALGSGANTTKFHFCRGPSSIMLVRIPERLFGKPDSLTQETALACLCRKIAKPDAQPGNSRLRKGPMVLWNGAQVMQLAQQRWCTKWNIIKRNTANWIQDFKTWSPNFPNGSRVRTETSTWALFFIAEECCTLDAVEMYRRQD